MNPLLQQLHDIEGLDTISSWPLAIGWWILMGCAFFIICLGIGLITYKINFKNSWKGDAFKNITALEKNLSDSNAREAAIALSEYLRRIAIRRFSRQECAGLAGEDWLKWLSKNDLKNFDWVAKGRLLIDAPYAPEQAFSTDQVRLLIKATKNWVH